MSKYKLVPLEITDEMVEASGCGGYYGKTARDQAQDLWSAMVASAPAVQVEPVAWQRVDRPERTITVLSRRTWKEVEDGVEFRALYAAPQPAEHHPECGCCGQTDRCDDDCDSADQQPDVTQLVEALDMTELRKLLLILRGNIGGAMWTLDDEEEELAVRTEKAIDAIAALAAYRKQGA